MMDHEDGHYHHESRPEQPGPEEEPQTGQESVEKSTAGAPFAETPKERLLSDVRAALSDGTITDADLRSLVTAPAVTAMPEPVLERPAVLEKSAANKLSAVEIMFYIAGIILFASLMTMLGQSWGSLNGPLRILLSFGVGMLLWLLGFVFSRQRVKSELRSGMENSMILTGALCVLVGGFIIMFQIVKPSDSTFPYAPVAITLFLLGVIHFAYDTFVRKDLVILLGLVLAVAAFPAYLIGLLASQHTQPDIYAIIFILSAGFLVYASRVLARVEPNRPALNHPFDSLAIFLTLGTMFSSMFTHYGLIWTLLLFVSIFGLFYLSIIKRNKQFLGNASFFLVVGVISVAFKYFSGMGVAASLVVAALGLLASAAFASSINRKYFKNAAPLTDTSLKAPGN